MTIANTDIPEFGVKRPNEERRDGGCGVVFDPKSQKYAVGQDTSGSFRFFSGGVDPDEDIKAGVLREVEEESGLYDFERVVKIAEAFAHYHNTLRKVNRVAHATCFLVILKSAYLKPVKLESHETFSLIWTDANQILANFIDRNANKDNDHWLYFFKKSVAEAIKLGYDKISKIS